MNYTQLGKTDLNVSRLCLGCWQLSPRFWGDVEIGPWETAIRRAEELGINFIDTANAYGEGYAEESLGKFLETAGLRDHFIIATKFYWNFHGQKRFPDTRYEHIIAECDDSLRRLRTDRIDLYQIHSWDPLTRPDEVAEAVHRLRREGKIRWAGASNLNVEQLELYGDLFDVATLQPKYNPLAREVEDSLFPYCLRKRIGTLVWSPLERGLLTGKYPDGHHFGDSRDQSPLFQAESLRRVREACEGLKPLAEELNLGIPGLIIRWALSHPAVNCAIIGFKKPEHIETLAQAPDEPLSREAWFAVAEAFAGIAG